MRIEMSRAKEPWLAQCWKREIHKCVKKEKRSTKGLSEEELIAMIDWGGHEFPCIVTRESLHALGTRGCRGGRVCNSFGDSQWRCRCETRALNKTNTHADDTYIINTLNIMILKYKLIYHNTNPWKYICYIHKLALSTMCGDHVVTQSNVFVDKINYHKVIIDWCILQNTVMIVSLWKHMYHMHTK